VDFNIYSSGYIGSFSYSVGGVSVSVTYNTAGSRFEGSLTASGLKPNFAYQLKLEGIPTDPGGVEANENLKSVGRTWTDPEPDLGYLVFDYFITDGNGDAYLEFSQDSSYHVLWTTDQRTPLAGDGPVKSTTFTPDSSHQAYDPSNGYTGDFDESTVGVYGEKEGSHDHGSTFLPDGHYYCYIAITEESFHNDYDLLYGGKWAGAMHGIVEFDLYTNYVPELPLGTVTALGTSLLSLFSFKVLKWKKE
jgi:hypothetical protein